MRRFRQLQARAIDKPDQNSPAADPWGERMPRSLGPWGATAVVVGVTIGSGIFRVPAIVAAQLHTPGPAMLCWLLGGLISLCGALSVAELGAALPRSGGIFAYLLESYGPVPAFLYGWACLMVITPAALGATSTIFAEYLGYFLPISASGVHYVAALTIALLAAINYMGLRRASAVMNITTAAKFLAVIVLGLLAFTAVRAPATVPLPAPAPHAANLSLLASALIPVLWTYDGWSNLTSVGGEVSRPQTTLPVGLVLGTVCVVLVYVLLNLGFWHALSATQMASSPLVAATAAAHIPAIGSAGAALVAGLVLVSTFSGLNGSMMTDPRIIYGMADRGLFFRPVARVSPRFKSPSIAIGLSAALGCAYVLQNDFAQLADRFVLGEWPFYALCVAGVYVLRHKRPELPRPYRVWGYPVLPALFLLASLVLIGNALVTDPRDTGITLLTIAAGLPAYAIWKWLG
ncbi:MAG TPA: amino acid permease [Steroidobacteraceae bacterium]|jgi:amino acid transporter|nr:amino acid permease [Steroidobacteraceae bacterium]